jgi:hypothetical protein
LAVSEDFKHAVVEKHTHSAIGERGGLEDVAVVSADLGRVGLIEGQDLRLIVIAQ